MVLSSNSRSAEIPGTKGVTRSAFFEVRVLGSLRADRRDLYMGVLPIRSCLSTHRRSRSCAPQPHHPPPHARFMGMFRGGRSPAPKTPKGRGVGEPREGRGGGAAASGLTPREPLPSVEVLYSEVPVEAKKDSRKIKVAKKEAWVAGMSAISRSDGSTHSVDTKMA